MKNSIRRVAFDNLYIALGTFLLALGVSMFMAPNKISAGGVTTVGTVLLHIFNVKISVTNLLFNAVLFVFGYRYLGKYAVVKTVSGILFFSFFLEITSYFPVYTSDLLIEAICGGILMGLGVGLVVRKEGSTGGSDFAALILARFFPHISLAKLILIIDCAIILMSGIVFKAFDITFYSAVCLYVSSVITDSVITVGNKAKVIYVLSKEAEKISEDIMTRFERGATGIHSTGMYSKDEKLMLMCVVRPKELPALVNMIRRIDKNAFIVINDVKEIFGEGFKIESSYDKIETKI